MMALAAFAVALAATLLLVPVLVLLLQVLLARGWRPAETTASEAGARPAAVVLMPAHDEALGIAATVAAVRAQLRAEDRLLVVADNCSDATAELARAAGAEVTERCDPARRGKGYALDHGLQVLAQGAVLPEVVVILDADCRLRRASLDRLVAEAAHRGRPVQALYLMHAPVGAGLGARLGEFAWRLRNELRPAAQARLDLPCQLMGSGMAFPFAVLQGATLATGNIVEDLQLGLDLACAGHAPRFCASARVDSQFPDHARDQATQRSRWEQGHLSVLLRQAPRLLAQAVSQRRIDLLALALDLAVPPLALLVMLLGAAWLVAIALGVAGAGWAPAALASSGLLLLTLAVLLAWQAVGRDVVALRELATVPAYVVRKLASYGRWATGRGTGWVRTARQAGEGAAATPPGDEVRP